MSPSGKIEEIEEIESEDPTEEFETLAQDEENRKRRLWATLLIGDLVMVFILGGVIADILYIRSSTPPLAQAGAERKGHKAAPPQAQPEPPTTAKPDDAKAAPAKPEAKAPPAAATAKPERPAGSPAVHAAALPQRAPEPMKAKAAPAAPAAAAPPAGSHARPVEFTYRTSSRAKQVFLRGPFLVRTNGKKAMIRGSDGIWRLSVSLLPGDYRFHFLVDGKRTPSETKRVE